MRVIMLANLFLKGDDLMMVFKDGTVYQGRGDIITFVDKVEADYKAPFMITYMNKRRIMQKGKRWLRDRLQYAVGIERELIRRAIYEAEDTVAEYEPDPEVLTYRVNVGADIEFMIGRQKYTGKIIMVAGGLYTVTVYGTLQELTLPTNGAYRITNRTYTPHVQHVRKGGRLRKGVRAIIHV